VKVHAKKDGLYVQGVFREDLPELLDVVVPQASAART
jgi:hypothetical protein